MTFSDYLATRRITDTPQGDFVKDARSDQAMAHITSWTELRDHLDSLFWCSSDAVKAARQVWRGYETKRRLASPPAS